MITKNLNKYLISLFLVLAACATPAPVVETPVQLERTPSSDYRVSLPTVTRAQQLSRYKDVATGHGYRSCEALGAARLERHLQGRKLTPGTNTSVDWVDTKLGQISFKGPLVDDTNYDGVLEELKGMSPDMFMNALRRDMSENPTAPVLVVDTLGLADGEVGMVEEGIKKAPNPYKKTVLILLQKEMKNVQTGKIPASCDQFATP